MERKEMGPVRVIHANKGQNSRINAMDDFKSGEVRVLVSTDVTARGMDISMVSHVINFDVPLIYEDYVHRIGRTGRAKNKGVAMTFANEVEMIHVGRIEEIIRKPIPRKEIPEGVTIEKTPFEEKQLIAREIDLIKRKENPDFKGAFHEKKRNFDKPRKFSLPKGKTKRKGRR
jgi:ATP-dependent RNA helicase RhlE